MILWIDKRTVMIDYTYRENLLLTSKRFFIRNRLCQEVGSVLEKNMINDNNNLRFWVLYFSSKFLYCDHSCFCLSSIRDATCVFSVCLICLDKWASSYVLIYRWLLTLACRFNDSYARLLQMRERELTADLWLQRSTTYLYIYI